MPIFCLPLNRPPPCQPTAVEQVLDPRTRMVLFKMLNRGVFTEINGCVSTGKEANVYHATGGASSTPDGAPAELAIKVYKTAILVFKDRDRCTPPQPLVAQCVVYAFVCSAAEGAGGAGSGRRHGAAIVGHSTRPSAHALPPAVHRCLPRDDALWDG